MSPDGCKPLRILIADDEVLARNRLEDLLKSEPGVEIVAQVANGNAAVEAIRTLHPDLVFLDVQMPGLTGIDVVRTIGADAMPATIFVTAYDEYALHAFDVAALDYLVKPFDDERFEQAFRRAREIIELKQLGKLREQLLAVLGGTPTPASAQPNAGSTGYLERIAVETRGKVRVVPVEEIEYITSKGPYAELHVGTQTHVIRESMQDLETRLDPERFFRIHRSAIVRLDLVETFLRGAGGDYEVQLKSGKRLRVSRSHREELEKRLGVS
jgi:two-component system, LytTR family, response regulator